MGITGHQKVACHQPQMHKYVLVILLLHQVHSQNRRHQLYLRFFATASASAKPHTFKTGDHVKFVIYSQSSGYLSPTQGPLRGPSFGNQGKVLLAFEDNGSSELSIRFDKPVPCGIDLGGLCEDDHGFFCNASDLRLESSVGKDMDKLVINALFEVVTSESKMGPLILFIKDVEKSIIGNLEYHVVFKSKLETLTDSVVVVGSHTQADNQKEKSHPGVLLFIKFGGNQTTLLDFVFPNNLRLGNEKKAKANALTVVSKTRMVSSL